MSLREEALQMIKGKRPIWRTREVIDFDPKLMPLRSQRDILDYIAKNDVKLPDEILVEWCPLKTDVMVSSPVGCSSIPKSWHWG